MGVLITTGTEGIQLNTEFYEKILAFIKGSSKVLLLIKFRGARKSVEWVIKDKEKYYTDYIEMVLGALGNKNKTESVYSIFKMEEKFRTFLYNNSQFDKSSLSMGGLDTKFSKEYIKPIQDNLKENGELYLYYGELLEKIDSNRVWD